MSEARILVVDDNPSNIQILGNTLKLNDLAFEFALSGHGAIQWLKKQRFDVVLLDLMMPEVDGFDTLKSIRENPEWQDISVIFLTAKTDFNALIRGFDVGAQDYITKPFNTKELISRVKAHMSMSAHQNLLRTFNARLEEEVKLRTAELETSVTKTRELNDSLSTLISNIPGAVFRGRLGDRLCMHYLSPQFLELTGYDPESVIGSDEAFSVLLEEGLPQIREAVKAHVQQSEPSFGVRLRVPHRNGDLIWVSMQGNARKSPTSKGQYEIEGVMYDITSEIAMEEQLMAASIKAADLERAFVARELHDGVQQSLATVALSLQGIGTSAMPADLQEKFQQALNMLNKSIKEVRDISHHLAPKSVVDLGLGSSLNELIRRQNLTNGTTFEFQENIGDQRFDPTVELNLYRIVQESLTNIRKYAEAHKVHLQLFQREELLTLMVEDDGVGFDKSEVLGRQRSFGLVSMETRALAINGVFELNTMTGKGTQILVEVPLKGKKKVTT